MTVYGIKSLIWKENKLYHPTFMGDRYILEIIVDETYPTMYWIEWAGGKRSSDFYNLTRARDNAVKHTLMDLNKQGIES